MFSLMVFVQIESDAEEDLPPAAEEITPDHWIGLSEPQRLSAHGRRLALKAALVQPEVNPVVPEAVKDQALRCGVTILPEVQCAALELYQLSGLAVPLALKERCVVNAGQT